MSWLRTLKEGPVSNIQVVCGKSLEPWLRSSLCQVLSGGTFGPRELPHLTWCRSRGEWERAKWRALTRNDRDSLALQVFLGSCVAQEGSRWFRVLLVEDVEVVELRARGPAMGHAGHLGRFSRGSEWTARPGNGGGHCQDSEYLQLQ